MITLTHINKTFGKQQVLHDICLTINPGEVVGLLGPNGAGKSTLMKIMTGVWQADKNKETQICVPEHIGYLPEQNPLYEEMYVREYLQFMARISHAGDDVENLIERVGLTAEANKRINQLSKGYKQRVGLAQALMGKPELIILDEPTTGLDPNQLIEIRQLIKGLAVDNHQCTVILSTHIMQEVKEMCNRVVIIDSGTIRTDQAIGQIDDLEQLFHQLTQNNA
ncbi:MAG: ABC transporter ATP-binding protein [Paludibacteraceae bacterium]|nr:ABC transporter ATP-binding protein [Paludibacteraceae bacterium]